MAKHKGQYLRCHHKRLSESLWTGGPEAGDGFFAPDRFSDVVSCQELKIEQTNIIYGFSQCHRGKTLNVASKTNPCPGPP